MARSVGVAISLNDSSTFHQTLSTTEARAGDDDDDDDAAGVILWSSFTELSSKWLGGWPGLSPIIFRAPPTKHLLEGPSKIKGNQGTKKETIGPPAKNKKCRTSLPTTLKMSSENGQNAQNKTKIRHPPSPDLHGLITPLTTF